MKYFKVVRITKDGRRVSRHIFNSEYCVEYSTDRFSTSTVKRQGLFVYNKRPNYTYDGEELWEVEIVKEMKLPKFRKNVDKINDGYIDIGHNPPTLEWPENTVMVKKVRLVSKVR